MPDDIVDKKIKMLKEYFPNVSFATLENQIIENIDKRLVGYFNQKEYSLDISGIANDAFFKPLFPNPVIIREHIDKFKKYENTFFKENKKRPNVVGFFIKPDSEKFAEELNKNLEKAFKIDPEITLVKKFTNMLGQNIFCQYIPVTNNKGELKYKFKWAFYNYFFHDPSTVYKAFCYFAHMNCTLYLFGADFSKFKEHQTERPFIPEKNCSFPDYLRNFFEKFTKEFDKINVDSFVWKDEAIWNEEKSIRYLLALFGLDGCFNASLKDIYYSFCIPILDKNNNLKLLYEDYFIKTGKNIILNTLQRKTDSSKMLKKILNKLKSKYKKLDLDIKDIYQAWNKIIYETLESLRDENTPKGQINYNPLEFELFINKIANRFSYKCIANQTIKEIAKEYGSILTVDDRGDIKNYCKIIRENFPNEYREKFSEEDNAYDKINTLYRLITFNEIKEKFSEKQLGIIEAIYNKAKLVPLETYKKIKKTEEDDEKYFENLYREKKEYYEEELLPDNVIEDKKNQDVAEGQNAEKIRGLIISFIEEEFENEKNWIQYIKKEKTDILFNYLSEYTPHSKGHLKRANKSKLYSKYCEIYNITDIQKINRKHKQFVKKVRNIMDMLKAEIVKDSLYQYFEEEFEGDDKWMQYVRKIRPYDLLKIMELYYKNKFFEKYCNISQTKDERAMSDKYQVFTGKMRRITGKLKVEIINDAMLQYFEEGFEEEKEWIQYIRKENIYSLFKMLESSSPNNKSDFFNKYFTITKKNEQMKEEVRRIFAERIQSIADKINPIKNSILQYFEKEFEREDKWMQYVRAKKTYILLKTLESFHPGSRENKNIEERKSKFYKKYCTVSKIKDEQIKNEKYPDFTEKIQSIADKLNEQEEKFKDSLKKQGHWRGVIS